ncbi:IS66 family insertion sequence element accessory protein TnpA [Stieleria varia]|uniref:Transposase n=1 Tax=Stieleria varia TaxID=2528005 RepID=A0A5C6B874_9BACT|nr:hypothetical protein [Stieleria varia]TWU07832.1 hypothetical protein Pla52n_04070 [Stieleria varia]
MTRSPDPELRRWWQQLLDAFDPDRSTVSQFCRDNRISITSFYKWRKRLQQSNRRPGNENKRLIPVRIVDHQELLSQCAARIHFSDDSQMEIMGSHAFLVPQIAAVLANAQCRQALTDEATS